MKNIVNDCGGKEGSGWADCALRINVLTEEETMDHQNINLLFYIKTYAIICCFLPSHHDVPHWHFKLATLLIFYKNKL